MVGFRGPGLERITSLLPIHIGAEMRGNGCPEDREIDLVRNGSVLRGNSWEWHRMRGRAGHVRSELYTQ